MAEAAAGTESGTTLARYLSELGAYPLLDTEEELRATRQIEELETLVWERLLCHPSTLPTVAARLEAALPVQVPALRALRRSGKATGRAADRAAFARAARRAAEALRAVDPDREALEPLLSDLPRLFPERGNAAYVSGVLRASQKAIVAREQFLRANLRLVVWIAGRYRRDLLPLQDLIQEGNLGLIKGLSRYDHRRGVKFSTYATWWIRHAINRAIADKGRGVRLPVHMVEARSRLAKAERRLSGALGRPPTTEEIAKSASLSTAKVERLRQDGVDRLISLDQPEAPGSERSLLDTFVDPQQAEHSPLDELVQQQLLDTLAPVMEEALTEMEASVLRWRFGLESGPELSLREIGDKYGLSRERIRQIEVQALQKLRRRMRRMKVMEIDEGRSA